MAKTPTSTDQHVGSRVRMRRLMLDMTQEKIAEALGLTFQQVQKYEKGANRIGASRLQQLAHILHVPVAFFFEGAPVDPSVTGTGDAPSPNDALQFVATPEGLALAKAFMRIDRPMIRRRIVALVKEIAGKEK